MTDYLEPEVEPWFANRDSEALLLYRVNRRPLPQRICLRSSRSTSSRILRPSCSSVKLLTPAGNISDFGGLGTEQ